MTAFYRGYVAKIAPDKQNLALGMAAAEAALGMQSEFVTIFNSFAAPRKLPPQPFLNIGAGLRLRYSELAADIE